MVERCQQMITQFLCIVTSNFGEQQQWPHKIPELQTILNSTTSSSRNYSPFFITFLEHPNFPFQSLVNSTPFYSDSSALTARFNLSNQLIKECEKVLEDSFDQAKSSFDANSRPNNINLGDVVYVETSQRYASSQIRRQIQGPLWKYIKITMLN